ncbi:hypothetical protein BCR32DRAFT_273300 [Anaeromyces robustus]|uniref:G-protein coupled receptors family 1 profile domain-containing protein n=1 Tax=Anaeromyces robustus TaxID=1754192 RepID=A0A1Y1VRF9_9FUNG|nr:hypothetical protein BCR32DRAFT_273300 [Anaeromyces robustus]|eukprot:ORX63869.1 hypothetical protein BCR32DRAFT_273300 [Anaeromyces robustus]
MFGANLKTKPIDNVGEVFLNVTVELLDHVNKTQYYTPSLSFFLILYTYFIVGDGKLWKHLVHVSFSGFVAVTLTSIFDIFRVYFTIDYVLQLKWIEAIFWHLNEYGYVYISYIKLKTVVNELEKKYWEYIMKILFVYNLIVRFIIAAVTIIGRTSSAGSHLQGLTFLPLALVEVIFMYLIIKAFIEQSNNNGISKDILSTMLNSTLTRMFIVALIYFLTSIVCFFYHPPILKGIKSIVWRAKAALGLIFLLDLLFIRIDLREKLGAIAYNSNSNSSKKNRSRSRSIGYTRVNTNYSSDLSQSKVTTLPRSNNTTYYNCNYDDQHLINLEVNDNYGLFKYNENNNIFKNQYNNNTNNSNKY